LKETQPLPKEGKRYNRSGDELESILDLLYPTAEGRAAVEHCGGRYLDIMWRSSRRFPVIPSTIRTYWELHSDGTLVGEEE